MNHHPYHDKDTTMEDLRHNSVLDLSDLESGILSHGMSSQDDETRHSGVEHSANEKMADIHDECVDDDLLLPSPVPTAVSRSVGAGASPTWQLPIVTRKEQSPIFRAESADQTSEGVEAMNSMTSYEEVTVHSEEVSYYDEITVEDDEESSASGFELGSSKEENSMSTISSEQIKDVASANESLNEVLFVEEADPVTAGNMDASHHVNSEVLMYRLTRNDEDETINNMQTSTSPLKRNEERNEELEEVITYHDQTRTADEEEVPDEKNEEACSERSIRQERSARNDQNNELDISKKASVGKDYTRACSPIDNRVNLTLWHKQEMNDTDGSQLNHVDEESSDIIQDEYIQAMLRNTQVELDSTRAEPDTTSVILAHQLNEIANDTTNVMASDGTSSGCEGECEGESSLTESAGVQVSESGQSTMSSAMVPHPQQANVSSGTFHLSAEVHAFLKAHTNVMQDASPNLTTSRVIQESGSRNPFSRFFAKHTVTNRESKPSNDSQELYNTRMQDEEEESSRSRLSASSMTELWKQTILYGSGLRSPDETMVSRITEVPSRIKSTNTTSEGTNTIAEAQETAERKSSGMQLKACLEAFGYYLDQQQAANSSAQNDCESPIRIIGLAPPNGSGIYKCVPWTADPYSQGDIVIRREDVSCIPDSVLDELVDADGMIRSKHVTSIPTEVESIIQSENASLYTHQEKERPGTHDDPDRLDTSLVLPYGADEPVANANDSLIAESLGMGGVEDELTGSSSGGEQARKSVTWNEFAHVKSDDPYLSGPLKLNDTDGSSRGISRREKNRKRYHRICQAFHAAPFWTRALIYGSIFMLFVAFGILLTAVSVDQNNGVDVEPYSPRFRSTLAPIPSPSVSPSETLHTSPKEVTEDGNNWLHPTQDTVTSPETVTDPPLESDEPDAMDTNGGDEEPPSFTTTVALPTIAATRRPPVIWGGGRD